MMIMVMMKVIIWKILMCRQGKQLHQLMSDQNPTVRGNKALKHWKNLQKDQ